MARLAGSLVKLRDQVNAAYPNRSKVSDGWIGDAAHAAVASDHNPNSSGVVTALDLTHDPAHGFDAHLVANRLIANRNPNLKYVISNRRMAGDWTGWQWRPYNGSNPHDKHIHVSVGRGPDGSSSPPYDGTENWDIMGTGGSMAGATENFINNDFVGSLMREQQPYDPVTKTWRDPAAKGFVGQSEEVVQQKVLESAERKEVERIYALGKAADKAGWKPGMPTDSSEFEEVGNSGSGLYQKVKG